MIVGRGGNVRETGQKWKAQMGYGKRYGGDPYWTTARFDSTDAEGKPVKTGARIFYYPRTKSVYQGESAERESRAYEAAAFDESQMTGNW